MDAVTISLVGSLLTVGHGTDGGSGTTSVVRGLAPPIVAVRDRAVIAHVEGETGPRRDPILVTDSATGKR